MGGHTRRSKQAVKESSTSTVICDFAPTVENWKQQIKVKGSIPVNQQRLTFTSQRTVKQNFALAKLIPDRQWQLVVDANIEDICKDLKGWRATLQSKNISAELLQPLVLKESDELGSFLHSKTANDLRQIGVPCCVFFLSFKEWIPHLQTKDCGPSIGETRRLDIKVDEELHGNIFLIDLHGDLNGFPIPVPLRYVMNGSQVAAKLFMVKQTAQYREDQRRRYQHCLGPALKNSNVEKSERSSEVNCQSSCNDYVVEIQQNCELTAFISRDNHQLRCIVVPVITIPLVETKGREQHPYACLLSEESNGPGEPSSNVLALPSTSEPGETSTVADASIVEEELLAATPATPTPKSMKKKRKKRSKKSSKENVGKCPHPEHDETGEAVISCRSAQTSSLEEKVSLFPVNGLNAEMTTDSETSAKGRLCASMNMEDLKGIVSSEVENTAIPLRHSILGPQLYEQETCSSLAASRSTLSTPWESNNELEIKCASDHCDPERNTKRVLGLSWGTRRHDEAIKDGDTSLDKELSPSCKPKTHVPEQSDIHDDLGGPSALEYNSGFSGSLKVAGDAKKLKESAHLKFQPEYQSTLHTEAIAHLNTSSSNYRRQRENQSGCHMRMNHWTQRAVEGESYLPHRKRQDQHFFAGLTSDESRSSAPFWRHQREGVPVSTHSWSKPKPKPLRTDDGVRFPSTSNIRNARNMPAWEQMPNLRHASNANSLTNSWENHGSLDSPWSFSRGQSYSSFNMQQRKSGKSNKIPNRFSDGLQSQNILNDRMALSPKLLDVLPNTSNVHSNEKAVPTGVSSKNLDKDKTRKSVMGPVLSTNSTSEVIHQETLSMEAFEPCIRQTAGNTSICSQDIKWNEELDKFNLGLPCTQLVEHLHEILNDVNAAYESWVLYEQVSNQNGKPMCEFGRVAKAVAPTIRASTSKQHQQHAGCLCKALVKPGCKPEQFLTQQIPDVQLSDFWHWYEEPSSYGVKVKLAESSKRTGSDFQAFFVPYLSAIQLFGCSGRRETANNKETTPLQQGELIDTNCLNQPILSILLPKPKASDDSCIKQESFNETKAGQCVVDCEQTVSDILSSSKRQCHCDVELLYEFFEQEKPQHRKPLIDRIKELVSQEPSSTGNSRLLNDAKMQDLHPASWFAVAWYPIYKIPDETFRSAFLTYHCMSCLQSMHLDSANCVDTLMCTITAPVVGMMSYNAQVKEWFSLSPSSEVRPDVLRHYLTKLETTATSMARGSLVKSSSSFKHADFNFFQSRGR